MPFASCENPRNPHCNNSLACCGRGRCFLGWPPRLRNSTSLWSLPACIRPSISVAQLRRQIEMAGFGRFWPVFSRNHRSGAPPDLLFALRQLPRSRMRNYSRAHPRGDAAAVIEAARWPDLAGFTSDFRRPCRGVRISRYSVRPVCTVFSPAHR